MQSLFQQNVSLTLRLLILSVICIILMTVDHRDETLRGFRSTIASYFVYPLQYTVALPGRMVDWASESLSSRQALLAENKQLKTGNLKLQAKQQRLVSLELENARLRELLRASSQVGEKILIAEVITVDQDFYKQQVIINKGKNQQLYLGQPVIDAKGVMGQIANLSEYSATVLLLSDPAHAIPVQSSRNGVRTIAQGKGNPHELELLHIPKNTDLRAGDLMITSGLGGRFPPNYPVAVVSEVDINPDAAFAKVTAIPTALLDKSREVLIVWPELNPES